MSYVRNLRWALCALPLALLLGVAGCSGSGSQAGSGSGSGAEKASDGGAPAAATARPGSPEDRSAAGADTQNRRNAQGGGAAQRAKLAPFPSGRAVVYTSNLRVRSDHVDDATARAKQLVTAAGGYVENESASGGRAGSTIAFKIPADRYPTVLDQLTRHVGSKLALRQQAEDVTEEVADVDSRVRSAEAALKSFRKLLDRAKTVGEVINVEQEISQRQADLEALQARQKSLSQRTRYATVTMSIEPPPGSAAKKEESRDGFLGGIEKGWNAFTAVVSGLALTLGWLLPFLVAAAAIGVPAVRIRKHLRARRTA